MNIDTYSYSSLLLRVLRMERRLEYHLSGKHDQKTHAPGGSRRGTPNGDLSNFGYGDKYPGKISDKVSPEFKSEIEGHLKNLPKEMVEKTGKVNVNMYKDVKDAEANGVYGLHPMDMAVYRSDYNDIVFLEKPMKGRGVSIEGVVAHEYGHAVDKNLRIGSRVGIAWKEDRATMPKSDFKKLSYYTDTTGGHRARGEAVAESISHILTEKGSHPILSKTFKKNLSGTIEAVDLRLKELGV